MNKIVLFVKFVFNLDVHIQQCVTFESFKSLSKEKSRDISKVMKQHFG